MCDVVLVLVCVYVLGSVCYVYVHVPANCAVYQLETVERKLIINVLCFNVDVVCWHDGAARARNRSLVAFMTHTNTATTTRMNV